LHVNESSGRRLTATVVWNSESPVRVRRPYLARFAGHQVAAAITATPGPGEFELELQRALPLDGLDHAFHLAEFGSEIQVASGTVREFLPEQDLRPAGLAVWFTGLSGAGKTTISTAVRDRLLAEDHLVEVLDGDAIRTTLSKGLGFSRQDRDENIHRIGFLARLLVREGAIVLIAAVSPYRDTRDEVRRDIGPFVEVFVNAPLNVCEQRDVKGLYQKAREGKIHGFTGIDDPYEPPLAPEVECHTDLESVEQSVERVMEQVRLKWGG
jgi:adenylylsulfate kinase